MQKWQNIHDLTPAPKDPVPFFFHVDPDEGASWDARFDARKAKTTDTTTSAVSTHNCTPSHVTIFGETQSVDIRWDADDGSHHYVGFRGGTLEQWEGIVEALQHALAEVRGGKDMSMVTVK